MADKAWKRAERRIAEYIGGERVPITGRQRGDAPDIKHPFMCVEVKYRASLPKSLHDAMDQAEAAVVGRQMPCVILIEKGQQVKDAFLVMRLEQWKKRYL